MTDILNAAVRMALSSRLGRAPTDAEVEAEIRALEETAEAGGEESVPPAERPPLTIPCPSCGAGVGEPCVSTLGRPASHAPRSTEAASAYAIAWGRTSALQIAAERALRFLAALNQDPTDRASLTSLESTIASIEQDVIPAIRALDAFTAATERAVPR